MNLDCQTNIYKGKYGGLDTGTLVHTQLTVPPGPQPSTQNRELILVVDLSGSMHKELPHIRASLKALRDFMCEKCTHKTQGIFVRLIGYNEDAKELYAGEFGSDDNSKFDEVADNLVAKGRTDMGAGLKLAFVKTDLEKATWIVVLSDGVCNKGTLQTPKAFADLAAYLPPYTRIESVGYGQNFDADIMRAIGDFHYISDLEFIPIFFGNLAQEVISTVAFGTTIRTTFPSRVVIGSSRLGCLHPERKCVYGVVPMMYRDNLCEWVESTEKSHITVSFWLLGNPMKQVTIPLKFEMPKLLKDPPDEVKKSYYRCAGGRRLRLLYSSLKKSDLFHIVTYIEEEIGKWTDPCAQEAKAEVLRYISKLDAGYDRNFLGYEVLGTSSDIRRQHPTLSQTEGAQKTCTAYQGYL